MRAKTAASGVRRSGPFQDLLSVEGHAVGALLHGRIGLVRADLNAVQRAIVLGAAVMLALRDRAPDAMVRVAVHVSDLLF